MIISASAMLAAYLLAQSPAPASAPRPPDTLGQSVGSLYKSIRRNLIESAEKMPEEHYAFKPTADVRSFGQIVGHLANTQYNFCAPVVPGGRPAGGKNYETLTTKAELLQALRDAMAFCDKAYDQLSDEALHAPAKFGQTPITGGYSLVFNIAHDNEHYGNLVTYMRLKGLVPPSSERSR